MLREGVRKSTAVGRGVDEGLALSILRGGDWLIEKERLLRRSGKKGGSILLKYSNRLRGKLRIGGNCLSHYKI